MPYHNSALAPVPIIINSKSRPVLCFAVTREEQTLTRTFVNSRTGRRIPCVSSYSSRDSFTHDTIPAAQLDRASCVIYRCVRCIRVLDVWCLTWRASQESAVAQIKRRYATVNLSPEDIHTCLYSM